MLGDGCLISAVRKMTTGRGVFKGGILGAYGLFSGVEGTVVVCIGHDRVYLDPYAFDDTTVCRWDTGMCGCFVCEDRVVCADVSL